MPKFLRLVKWLAFASIPILVASIFIPAMTGFVVRGNPDHYDSASHAMVLVRCCQQYAIDHSGNFPPSLEDIFPTYCTDRSYLVSPFRFLLVSSPASVHDFHRAYSPSSFLEKPNVRRRSYLHVGFFGRYGVWLERRGDAQKGGKIDGQCAEYLPGLQAICA